MPLKSFTLILGFVLMLLWSGGSLFPHAVRAQSVWEDPSATDDPSLQDDPSLDGGFDQEFQDLTDEELNQFDTQGGETQDSFLNNQDNQNPQDGYVDEESFNDNAARSLELDLLKRRSLLLEEKINFPFNVAYGAGTGLMIGGWFALLSARTARDTLRSIGLGIVLGSFVGSMVGTRSLWDPNAPRPPNQPQAQNSSTPPSLAFAFPGKKGFQLSFHLTF